MLPPSTSGFFLLLSSPSSLSFLSPPPLYSIYRYTPQHRIFAGRDDPAKLWGPARTGFDVADWDLNHLSPTLLPLMAPPPRPPRRRPAFPALLSPRPTGLVNTDNTFCFMNVILRLLACLPLNWGEAPRPFSPLLSALYALSHGARVGVLLLQRVRSGMSGFIQGKQHCSFDLLQRWLGVLGGRFAGRVEVVMAVPPHLRGKGPARLCSLSEIPQLRRVIGAGRDFSTADGFLVLLDRQHTTGKKNTVRGCVSWRSADLAAFRACAVTNLTASRVHTTHPLFSSFFSDT